MISNMEKQPKFDYSDIKFKDNGKLKLIIVVGTRPEIIRLAAVINKCRQYFDVILAHTGQNYDYNLNGIFFKDLKLAEPEVDNDTGESAGSCPLRRGGKRGDTGNRLFLFSAGKYCIWFR